jgi:DNA-binding transcriptional ArsR family regulator
MTINTESRERIAQEILRLTREDRSQGWIAEHLGVDQKTVSNHQRKLRAAGLIPATSRRVLGRDGVMRAPHSRRRTSPRGSERYSRNEITEPSAEIHWHGEVTIDGDRWSWPVARPFYLYRVYCECGDLIYVGITGDLERRLRDHHRHARWADHAARIEFDLYHEPDARRLEKELIVHHNPLYNMQDNPWAWQAGPTTCVRCRS